MHNLCIEAQVSSPGEFFFCFFFFNYARRSASRILPQEILHEISLPVYPCLHPGCDFSTSNIEALDWHIKTHPLDLRIDINKLILVAQDASVLYNTTFAGPTSSSMNANNNNNHSIASAPALSPDRGFKCTFPGCKCICVRSKDLDRHIRKHQSGLVLFDCLEPGCDRQGTKGFYRRDKLIEHQKRHRQ